MNKYHNIKTEIDGITFASKAEARRYQELKLMERAGVIGELELQPSFALVVNGTKICRYVADFKYLDKEKSTNAEDCRVVEDVKGVKTPAYRLKKKLMKAIHGIEVQEI